MSCWRWLTNTWALSVLSLNRKMKGEWQFKLFLCVATAVIVTPCFPSKLADSLSLWSSWWLYSRPPTTIMGTNISAALQMEVPSRRVPCRARVCQWCGKILRILNSQKLTGLKISDKKKRQTEAEQWRADDNSVRSQPERSTVFWAASKKGWPAERERWLSSSTPPLWGIICSTVSWPAAPSIRRMQKCWIYFRRGPLRRSESYSTFPMKKDWAFPLFVLHFANLVSYYNTEQDVIVPDYSVYSTH